VAETFIEVNGVQLCSESFGDAADPPVLLVSGLGSSMLWWDEGFCTRLAGHGRFVLRYDHRDTGRSAADEPGRPRYDGGDLTRDAVAVLDAFGLADAHVVGVSAGGGIAQELGTDSGDRVRSLVLISTSPATPGDRDLPPPTDAFTQFVTTAEVDWDDVASVTEYLVGYSKVLNGSVRPFDEEATRAFVRRDLERSRNVASLQNHDLVAGEGPPTAPLSTIDVPTLVVHGTADPMFPLPHGEALADEIPGATLLPLEGAGHGVDSRDRDTLLRAVVEHTGEHPVPLGR
jgi:pimeloyl-ACP methyl ester carboxylesterase